MMDNEQSEIIRRWRELEDVVKERQLFDGYSRAREASLYELKNFAHGNSTREHVAKLKRDELQAFDRYVEHRTEC